MTQSAPYFSISRLRVFSAFLLSLLMISAPMTVWDLMVAHSASSRLPA